MELKDHPTYEISIILLSAYASYLVADLCELSGLLAVFFSGVFIRHYHMYNVSKASSFAFKHLLSTIAFLSENFIYLYLGISVMACTSLVSLNFRPVMLFLMVTTVKMVRKLTDTDSFKWDWGFILANFGVCLVARALNTFPLCTLANLCGRKTKILPKDMVVIWFSGLRGAIAFALALNVTTTENPEHAAIIKSSTLFTVLFTTVVRSNLKHLHQLSHGNSKHCDVSRTSSWAWARVRCCRHLGLANRWETDKHREPRESIAFRVCGLAF